MKKLLLLSFLLLSVLTTTGQGTLYFNTHLTGNWYAGGEGTFSLTTNFFSYDVQTAFGFDAGQIRSPWGSSNAPVVFNLSLIYCEPPGPPVFDGACYFRWHRILSDQEIADLQSGKWFVYVKPDPTSEYFLQGQILVIPEPSIPGLSILGLLTISALRFAQRHRGNAGNNHEANQTISCLPVRANQRLIH